jgi:hypothetical protein
MFVVQREACGLCYSRSVMRDYKVPPEVQGRMGYFRQHDTHFDPAARRHRAGQVKAPDTDMGVVAGACPGHVDYCCSAPQNSRSPGQARDAAGTSFDVTEIRSSMLNP